MPSKLSHVGPDSGQPATEERIDTELKLARCVSFAILTNWSGIQVEVVILDTNIGDGIDDIWALAMLLAMPELDLTLIGLDFWLYDLQ